MKAKDAAALARDKVGTTMHEFKAGTLTSYRGPRKKGKPVVDRDQAIAIALSQARRLAGGDK